MRILLISHEASRTGAPRVAALVARCLVGRGHEVHIVSRTRGPLLVDFAAEAPTSEEFGHRVRRRVRGIRALRGLAWWLDTAVAAITIARHRPDVVYVNSSAAAIYLRPARWWRRRSVLHVHESGPVTDRFLTQHRASEEVAHTQLIACSPSVLVELAATTGVSRDAIVLLPSVPDDAKVLAQSVAEPAIADRAPGTLVVGCCGSAERRKGADLWAQIATEVRQLVPDREVSFVWVGDPGDVPTPTGPGVDYLGPRANPYPLMRSFDIAALPSRDDPFPLVVLEAMLLGRPVVAFGVGAVADQIGDTGIVVEPQDVNAFARALAELLTDDERRLALGTAAQRRAEELYSTAAFSQQLAALIDTRG